MLQSLVRASRLILCYVLTTWYTTNQGKRAPTWLKIGIRDIKHQFKQADKRKNRFLRHESHVFTRYRSKKNNQPLFLDIWTVILENTWIITKQLKVLDSWYINHYMLMNKVKKISCLHCILDKITGNCATSEDSDQPVRSLSLIR